MLASASLNGGRPPTVPANGEDGDGDADFEDDAEEGEVAQASTVTALHNVPRRINMRGSKVQRKFRIPLVVRDSEGKIMAGRRSRGGLPGSGVRVSSGKPKEMVSFLKK